MKARTRTALLLLMEVAVLANVGYSCWRTMYLFWNGAYAPTEEGVVMEFLRHSDPELYEMFENPALRAVLWLFLSLLVGGVVTQAVAVRLFRGTRWLSGRHEEQPLETRRVIITPPPENEP